MAKHINDAKGHTVGLHRKTLITQRAHRNSDIVTPVHFPLTAKVSPSNAVGHLTLRKNSQTSNAVDELAQADQKGAQPEEWAGLFAAIGIYPLPGHDAYNDTTLHRMLMYIVHAPEHRPFSTLAYRSTDWYIMGGQQGGRSSVKHPHPVVSTYIQTTYNSSRSIR